jgi:hypothetical protein
MEVTSNSNDDASPPAVRGSGNGSPFASVNSGAASERAMTALVGDSAAGVSLTGAPAPRSLATSLRLIPVSRLTRLSVYSFPPM